MNLMSNIEGLTEAITEVWGEETEFEEHGFEYVVFLIEKDIEDIRDDNWDEEETTEELADIIINASRAIHEIAGKTPEEVIEDRLENRMNGNTTELVERYEKIFEREHRDTK